MIDDMKDMMLERLKVWYSRNNSQFPDKIIVYRDGVSEGMSMEIICWGSRTQGVPDLL